MLDLGTRTYLQPPTVYPATTSNAKQDARAPLASRRAANAWLASRDNFPWRASGHTDHQTLASRRPLEGDLARGPGVAGGFPHDHSPPIWQRLPATDEYLHTFTAVTELDAAAIFPIVS